MNDTPKTDARLQAEAVIVLLCQLERENAALRSLVREAMTDHVDFYDLDKAEDFIARARAALGEDTP